MYIKEKISTIIFFFYDFIIISNQNIIIMHKEMYYILYLYADDINIQNR